MRFRPTVPPTRVSRLPRSNGACRRPQPFWLWRSARSWPRGICSRRKRHRTTPQWYRMPARRRSRSLRRNSARTRRGPISTRDVCGASTTRRRTHLKRPSRRPRPQRQRLRPAGEAGTPSPPHRQPLRRLQLRRTQLNRLWLSRLRLSRQEQRTRHRPQRRRTRRTRETRSCNLCFQPPHRTPEPTPPPTPTRAPLMLHNVVGRSIGITIPAFSDFASS